MPLTAGVQIVGRFEILAPLGAGSMGEVYQAHDLKLRRDVALKLLSPALAKSEEHLLRFEREARAASALNHPHICTIYDVGQAPEAENRPYLVMELLRGMALFEVLGSGPLSVSTTIGLGVQIADALDAAHNAGIIHRDLKPANIFVTARGDAKLLDFGLAAMNDTVEASEPAGRTDEHHPTVLTNPGTAVGTVLYMSPEQALGDPLDQRTDLFSLGLVLYEMLTGRRAFEGRSTTAIVDAILHATPVGLEAADVSNVPKDLRRLLTRLLDKDRDRRPSTAAEVAAQLRAVQSGSIAGREYAALRSDPAGSGAPRAQSSVATKIASLGPRDGSSGLTRALSAGNVREAAVFAVVMILMVLGGYGIFTWYRGRPTLTTAREPLLLTEFENTTGEAVFDGALKDALEIQLQQSPYVSVVPRSQVRSTLQLMARSPDEAVTETVARDLCERLGVKAIVLGSIAPLAPAYVITLEARACRTGDRLATEQIQAAAKTNVLASVSAASASIREKLGESIGSIERFNVPAQNATTASLEALQSYSRGLDTRFKNGDAQSIPFFERALELDPNFALASARLAAIYTNLRDLVQAQTYIKRAYARSDSLSAPERLFIRSQYHFIVTGRLDEVVATYQTWIDTYPDDWVPHNNVSAAYAKLNRFEDAAREGKIAVRLGSNSVLVYQQYARSLMALDRLPDVSGVLAEAAANGLDSSVLHQFGYDLAFVANDASGMQEHLRATRARADGYLVTTEAARVAMATGQINAGHTLYAEAVAAARAAGASDVAGSLVAEEALADALLGDPTRAQAKLQQAVGLGNGVETTWTASLAAAFSGRTAQATQLADAFDRQSPPSPDISRAASPALRAAVALAANDGRQALDILSDAGPFEHNNGSWLPYLRGLAAESARDNQAAVTLLRDVVSRHGQDPTSLLHVIARVPLARALVGLGAVAEARHKSSTELRRNGASADAILVNHQMQTAVHRRVRPHCPRLQRPRSPRRPARRPRTHER